MGKQNPEKNETSDPVIPETARKAWQDFFSEIKKRCLDRNFGTLSKSEFDLMLFHYYLVNKQEEVGSRYVSDYDIGRDLGLTIQRVRSLRERDALKWGLKDDWKKRFRECVKSARYEESTDVVKIPVPDVNVVKEVRNFLETQELMDDFQLNPKVFQCKIDVLATICLGLDGSLQGDKCGKVLTLLRDCKDKKVKRAIDELEHPIRAIFTKAALNSVKGILSQIPHAGEVLKNLFDAWQEIAE